VGGPNVLEARLRQAGADAGHDFLERDTEEDSDVRTLVSRRASKRLTVAA